MILFEVCVFRTVGKWIGELLVLFRQLDWFEGLVVVGWIGGRSNRRVWLG